MDARIHRSSPVGRRAPFCWRGVRVRISWITRWPGSITRSERDVVEEAAINQQVHEVPVALSTASVFPERTADAFEMAARLGYDGIEVMVTADPVSQDAEVLRRLS